MSEDPGAGDSLPKNLKCAGSEKDARESGALIAKEPEIFRVQKGRPPLNSRRERTMDLQAIKDLNNSYVTQWKGDDPELRKSALKRLGDATEEEVLDLALADLDDADRNLRFQAVKYIGRYDGTKVEAGLLKALSDSARRVRRRACGLAARFAENSDIAARLQEIMNDESEPRKIRGGALGALSGGRFRARLDRSAAEAIEFLSDESDLARYRERALNVLFFLDPLTDDARDVLRYVVETGSKEEAVDATRALCGFRMTNLAWIRGKERRHAAIEYEQARQGRALIWVPREHTRREHMSDDDI